MTKQTWTAAVSALLFVVLAAVIAMVPVPYVTWSPGETHDLLGQDQGQPAIQVTGVPTYPAAGRLLMTTVAVSTAENRLSLPEVLFSYWLPSRDALPRESVYRPGVPAADVDRNQTRLMADAQSHAVVAALRAARIPVVELPMVSSVANAGPANGRLLPGDLIRSVDNEPVASVQAVRDAVTARHVGEPVLFTLIRNGVETRETVTTVASPTQPDVPAVGINLSVGYRYAPVVTFGIDPAIGGSSAGLMLALAVYEKVTARDVTGGRVVAGTGEMDPDGRVAAVGGTRQKLAGAARDGAEVFLLPRDNCADLSDRPANVRLVAVSTLGEALAGLASLTDPDEAEEVATCP